MDEKDELGNPKSLAGRELQGRYLLQDIIASGGYGVVYRAIDQKFNLPVAIKIGYSSNEFMKEARLASQVQHRHIVRVSDFGCDEGVSYLVMELLHGEVLEDLFNRQGQQLSGRQLRKLVSEIGDALAFVHASGLVHRDLKPRNIILRDQVGLEGDSRGKSDFVLLDFGIAAKIDTNTTLRNRTYDGAGTVEYMAPEQLGPSSQSTPQSDIYAFGIILYQMMTGKVPFSMDGTSLVSRADCVEKIIHANVPRFDEISPNRKFPSDIESLILLCLEKDPQRRPQSMLKLSRKFLEIERLQPITFEVSEPDNSNNSNLPANASAPIGLAQTVRHTRPFQPVFARLRRIRWYFITAIFVALIAFFMNRQLTPQPVEPYALLVNEHGEIVNDGDTFVLKSGQNLTLSFTVNELDKNNSLKFDESVTLEELTTIRKKNGPIPGRSQDFTISATDQLLQNGGTVDVVLTATNADKNQSFKRTLTIAVQRPSLWMPAELRELGYYVPAIANRCVVGNRIYASVVDRWINNRSIRFRLIPTTKIDDQVVSAFYVMEEPVKNFLFDAFSKTRSNFLIEDRSPAERRWEITGMEDLPVVDIYAIEAQRFAWWLAGPHYGTLPSTTEWELAAGYWSFVREFETEFSHNPRITHSQLRQVFPKRVTLDFLGSEAWVGRKPSLSQFEESNREALIGHSPYGCALAQLQDGKYITELTRTILDTSLQTKDLRTVYSDEKISLEEPTLSEGLSISVRGTGERGTEIDWIKETDDKLSVKSPDELNDVALSLGLDGIGRKPYVGFRVVIPVDFERD